MHGYGFGWSFLPMIFMWFFGAAVLVGVILLIVKLTAGSSGSGDIRKEQQDTAEEILKQRYARGEIAREEYERMLADIRK